MTEAAIRVSGLVKRFGSVVALDGVDLEVARGTIFGLLGPNGAGKTTAVRILATVIKPDSGHAEVLGHDIAGDPWGVRSVIGLAGQFAAVDANLTGRENLRMVGRLAHMVRRDIEPRAGELLERFGLSDAAERPAKTYSGGMRRRLDLAASLMSRPKVLFLDEPTTGLDPHSRFELWDMIRELVAEGTTVLLTTQYMEEADRLAGMIAVVDNGRVIATDTPVALKQKLGSSVVEIGFASEDQALRAAGLLASSVAPAEHEGQIIRISSDDGARVLTRVLRRLEDEGFEPASVAVREPSLDDVFVKLTGRHAVDESNTDEAEAVR